MVYSTTFFLLSTSGLVAFFLALGVGLGRVGRPVFWSGRLEIPPVVLGLVLFFLLHRLGVWPSIWVGFLFFLLPIYVVEIERQLQGLDISWLEAAIALGGGVLEARGQIFFPALRSRLLPIFIYGLARALGETALVVVVLGPKAKRVLAGQIFRHLAQRSIDLSTLLGLLFIFILDGLATYLQRRPKT